MIKDKEARWFINADQIGMVDCTDNGAWALNIDGAINTEHVTSIIYDGRCVWTKHDGFIDSFFVIALAAAAEKAKKLNILESGLFYAPYIPIIKMS